MPRRLIRDPRRRRRLAKGLVTARQDIWQRADWRSSPPKFPPPLLDPSGMPGMLRRSTSPAAAEIDAASVADLVCEQNGVTTKSQAHWSHVVEAGVNAGHLEAPSGHASRTSQFLSPVERTREPRRKSFAVLDAGGSRSNRRLNRRSSAP